MNLIMKLDIENTSNLGFVSGLSSSEFRQVELEIIHDNRHLENEIAMTFS